MYRPPLRPCSAFVSATLSLCLLMHPARSEDVNEAEILKALSGQPDKGIKGGGASKMSSTEDAALLDKLRQKSAVSLTLGERKQLDLAIAEKPKVDLEMDFDYRSDSLRGRSRDVAEKLGRVLSSGSLGTETFLIAGHTDAKGSAAANRALSQRRAEAVKRFLVERYGVSADRLVCIGYGEERLKNPANPTGRENRRVQTVNMTISQRAEQKP